MLPEDPIVTEKKRKRAGKVVDTGSIPAAQLQEAIETNEKLDSLTAAISEEKEQEVVIKGLKLITIKGDKGDKGEDGLTPTDEELKAIIQPLIPEVKDGEDYVLTEEDKEEIAEKVKVPVVEKVIERTKTVVEKPIITNEVKEVAKYEEGEAIFKKIKKFLKIEAIEDLDRLLRSMAANGVVEYVGKAFDYIRNLADVKLTNLQVGDSLVWNGSFWVNSASAGGGVSLATEMVTAVQDGENVTIDLTQLANYATLSAVQFSTYNGQIVDKTRWSIVGSVLTITDAYTPSSFQVQYTYA